MGIRQVTHFLRLGTRKFIETNPPGTLYVYLNYGLHWLLNFLVKGKSVNGFVLIRALEPTRGCQRMAERRGGSGERTLCSGPGKLTQALAIDGAFHGRDFFQISGALLLHRGQPVSVEMRSAGRDHEIGGVRLALSPGRIRLCQRSKKKTRLRAN